jgi:HEAT repeat protein
MSITQAASSGDVAEKCHALRSMIGTPLSVEELGIVRRLLLAEHPDIVCLAAWVLAKAGNSESIQLLVEALDRYYQQFAGPPFNHRPITVPDINGSLRLLMQISRTTDLIHLFQHSRPEQQIDAAELLGDRKTVEAIPALVQGLHSRTQAVVIASAKALAAIGSVSAIEALKEVYAEQKRVCQSMHIHLDATLRQMLFTSLLQLVGDDELLKLFDEGDTFERCMIATACSSRSSSQSEIILKQASADSAKEVRASAAWALARLGEDSRT